MFSKSHYIFIILLAGFMLSSQVLHAREVSLADNQILLTKTHGGDGSAWGQSDCLSCHVRRNIHATAPAIKDIVLNVGYASCTGCHGQNGTTVERQCVICHNEQLLPKNPIMQNIKNHNFSINADDALMDAACVSCHDRSDMDGEFEVQVDLTHYQAQNDLDLPYRNQADFCLRCHNQNHQQPGFEMTARFANDPLVSMARNYKFIDMHGNRKGTGQRTYAGLRTSDYQYGTVVDCTDCHAMHGTHNEKLLIDRTDTGAFLLPAALRELPVYIDIKHDNYAQHCVVCHESITDVEATSEDTGNGLSGVHRVAGPCIECHRHGMAVQTGL